MQLVPVCFILQHYSSVKLLLNNPGTLKMKAYLLSENYTVIYWKKQTNKPAIVLFVPLQIYNENYYGWYGSDLIYSPHSTVLLIKNIFKA